MPRIVAGGEVLPALRDAARDANCDSIIAAGGDGTVSAAAALAVHHEKMLGILPAGTMNLAARALGMPLDLDQAVTSLANSVAARCDIATVNGRPFLHHVSFGLHPRIVRQRAQYRFGSRFGKMLAGVRATLAIIGQSRALKVRIGRGSVLSAGRFSLLAISNNPFAEGHLPYPDRLDRGLLGVYSAEVLAPVAAMRLAADLVVGSWSANPDLKVASVTEIEFEIVSRRGAVSAVVDGELVRLAPKISIRSRPGALRVLIPEHASGIAAGVVARSA
ncbi:MAG: diacylglycerol kinase family protein [Hyphomicrobiales bacterium]